MSGVEKGGVEVRVNFLQGKEFKRGRKKETLSARHRRNETKKREMEAPRDLEGRKVRD